MFLLFEAPFLASLCTMRTILGCHPVSVWLPSVEGSISHCSHDYFLGRKCKLGSDTSLPGTQRSTCLCLLSDRRKAFTTTPRRRSCFWNKLQGTGNGCNPSTREAQQEDHKFETSLGHSVRPCLEWLNAESSWPDNTEALRPVIVIAPS